MTSDVIGSRPGRQNGRGIPCTGLALYVGVVFACAVDIISLDGDPLSHTLRHAELPHLRMTAPGSVLPACTCWVTGWCTNVRTFHWQMCWWATLPGQGDRVGVTRVGAKRLGSC
jgi:hypothetical protein